MAGCQLGPVVVLEVRLQPQDAMGRQRQQAVAPGCGDKYKIQEKGPVTQPLGLSAQGSEVVVATAGSAGQQSAGLDLAGRLVTALMVNSAAIVKIDGFVHPAGFMLQRLLERDAPVDVLNGLVVGGFCRLVPGVANTAVDE